MLYESTIGLLLSVWDILLSLPESWQVDGEHVFFTTMLRVSSETPRPSGANISVHGLN